MGPAQEPASVEDRAALTAALVAEATRKAGLVWLSYADQDGSSSPRPAWHEWVEGAAYVVFGGGEQDLPGLDQVTEVTVIVPSKDTRARVVSWIGRVYLVPQTDETWPAATAALAASRLNAEGGAAMIDRWARESIVMRITPTGQILEAADDPSTVSLAERPRLTPATTLGRQPFMLGGIRRRKA